VQRRGKRGKTSDGLFHPGVLQPKGERKRNEVTLPKKPTIPRGGVEFVNLREKNADRQISIKKDR